MEHYHGERWGTGDPAFETDPHLKRMRARLYIWLGLFVAAILGIVLVGALLVPPLFERGVHPALPLLPVGVLLVIASIGFAWSMTATKRALDEFKERQRREWTRDPFA